MRPPHESDHLPTTTTPKYHKRVFLLYNSRFHSDQLSQTTTFAMSLGQSLQTGSTVSVSEPELSVKLWSDHEVLVYTGGQWGTICADHWSNNEANAVCRQLGYLHGLRNTSAGGRVFPHVLHDMRCEVNVTSLQQCTSQAVRSDVCQNRRSAAVDCTNSSSKMQFVVVVVVTF